MSTQVHEQILTYMRMLRVANKHQIARLMPQWAEGPSRVNNTSKHMNEICPPLERLGGGVYRLNTKSTLQPHALKLTDCLVQVLKVEGEVTIHREVTVPIGQRLDSVCFIVRGDKALVFILEAALTEGEDSLRAKKRAFDDFPGKLGFLADLVNYPIPHYDFVVAGENVNVGYEFNQYLKEVIR